MITNWKDLRIGAAYRNTHDNDCWKLLDIDYDEESATLYLKIELLYDPQDYWSFNEFNPSRDEFVDANSLFETINHLEYIEGSESRLWRVLNG